jgi:signal transduction histidine kinase
MATVQNATERLLLLEIAELRASCKRLVLAGDADRRALERELHDGVQQRLVALAVDVQRAADLMAADPAAAKAVLGELRAGLQSALDDAAQLAERIHPPLLEAGGLVPALRSAVARAGIAATVKVDSKTSFTRALGAAVYWCCLCALELVPDGGHAEVSVSDRDGVLAFEVVVPGGSVEPGRQLRDRVEALGGRLTIASEPGGVTRISGSLPATE